MVIEYVNELNFKETIKKKPYHFMDLTLLDDNDKILDKCIICGNDIKKNDSVNNISDDDLLIDLSKCPFCQSIYHMICLAQISINFEFALIPQVVECIVCSRKYNWNDFLM